LAPIVERGASKLFKDADEAVADLKSGSVILSSGFGLCGVAGKYKAIEESAYAWLTIMAARNPYLRYTTSRIKEPALLNRDFEQCRRSW